MAGGGCGIGWIVSLSYDLGFSWLRCIGVDGVGLGCLVLYIDGFHK